MAYETYDTSEEKAYWSDEKILYTRADKKLQPTMSQSVSPVGGNTSSPPGASKRGLRCRIWAWTWNNYTVSDVSHILDYLKDTSYIFQEETGKEGTPHLQGYVQFKFQKDFNTLKTAFPKVHWEKAKDPNGCTGATPVG